MTRRVRDAMPFLVLFALIGLLTALIPAVIGAEHNAQAACGARHAVLVEGFCIDSSAVRSVP